MKKYMEQKQYAQNCLRNPSENDEEERKKKTWKRLLYKFYQRINCVQHKN